MGILYQHPRYYEIAFGFRDIRKEVDVIESLISEHSHLPVRHILEVACGNAPYLGELARRGYRYTGLDLSQEMLDYTQAKADGLRGDITLLRADMTDFKLDCPADFACLLLGSTYLSSSAQLCAHLDTMANALQPGGLYLLEWCVQFDPVTNLKDSWTMEQDGIRINIHYSTCLLNRLEQTYQENIIMSIDDHGQQKTLREQAVKLAIYPQEFLLRVTAHPHFEFVGWWNDWELAEPLNGTELQINRPIIVAKRI